MKTWRSLVCFAVLTLMGALLIGCSAGGGLDHILGGDHGSGAAKTKSIAVADNGNSRVLIYNYPVSTNGNAVIVLGQPDFATTTKGAGATGMTNPNAVFFDSKGNLWVADTGNNRVLEFTAPFTNGQAAAVVLGEPDFTSVAGGLGQSLLLSPSGVTVDGSGNVWVTDTDNLRAVEFQPPFTNGMNASVVLGQPDFNTRVCDISATNICFPWQGIVADGGGNVWVTDTNNWRLLEFKTPFSNGMAASTVIGEPDMNTAVFGTSATQIGGFWGVTFDKTGNLWASDPFNNRVLEYKPPFSNGMAASIVIGQPDFTSSNTGGDAAGFDLSSGPVFDSAGNLYVADVSNSRVLIFPSPFSNGMSATTVLGQPDFTSTNTNQGGAPGANTMKFASSVATH